MLARSGRLPTSGDYAYEVKWDGFRAIVSTEETLHVGEWVGPFALLKSTVAYVRVVA
jgi:hypothetical protein